VHRKAPVAGAAHMAVPIGGFALPGAIGGAGFDVYTYDDAPGVKVVVDNSLAVI